MVLPEAGGRAEPDPGKGDHLGASLPGELAHRLQGIAGPGLCIRLVDQIAAPQGLEAPSAQLRQALIECDSGLAEELVAGIAEAEDRVSQLFQPRRPFAIQEGVQFERTLRGLAFTLGADHQ